VLVVRCCSLLFVAVADLLLSPIQITDFGLAKHVSCPSSLTTYYGTELYMAPEVRRQLDDDTTDPYTPAVDIWSLGVILHYMLFGRHPACARANDTGLSTSTERTYSVF
jgi:serine/threonine protein kinase